VICGNHSTKYFAGSRFNKCNTNTRNVKQGYHDLGLLRFQLSFIELAGVEGRRGGGVEDGSYLSEEQIKGAIHPHSMYRRGGGGG
jgi:hypothetical protein